jgi:hypothetical protein
MAASETGPQHIVSITPSWGIATVMAKDAVSEIPPTMRDLDQTAGETRSDQGSRSLRQPRGKPDRINAAS